jgi:hypothetical protein
VLKRYTQKYWRRNEETIYGKVKALLMEEMHFYKEENLHFKNPNPQDLLGYSAYSRFTKFDEHVKEYSLPSFVHYLFDQPLFHSRSIGWTG